MMTNIEIYFDYIRNNRMNFKILNKGGKFILDQVYAKIWSSELFSSTVCQARIPKSKTANLHYLNWMCKRFGYS